MHMEEAAWQRCRHGRQLNWRRKQNIRCFKRCLISLSRGKAFPKKLELGPQKVQELRWKCHSVWVSQVLGSCSWCTGAGVCCGQLLWLWVFATCETQTQGVSSWISNTRVILGKAEFSFCHKECGTGDSGDISDDAEDDWTETEPILSHPASLAMDFMSCMVNFTKYHKSL